MKEIKAIIQPVRLDEVLDALRRIENLPAVMVSSAQAISVELGQHNPVMKTRLEVIVPDEIVEPVLEAIAQHARTGQPGNGRIVVIPVETTVAIRTGERQGKPARTGDTPGTG